VIDWVVPHWRIGLLEVSGYDNIVLNHHGDLNWMIDWAVLN